MTTNKVRLAALLSLMALSLFGLQTSFRTQAGVLAPVSRTDKENTLKLLLRPNELLFGVRWQSEAATPLWDPRLGGFKGERDSGLIQSGVAASLCHRTPKAARSPNSSD